ncbi:ABC transporter permease [Mycobacterium barrassiae]|uniref:ABC transporter permease n=1 Tax=Mycobacterium barrassiae TaxID=319709 RepID=UPI0022658CD9|nr:ABC transporter permease [Mycobacterium barrassiae]MCV7298528.1 ABC transporter permease [Mycobacterium barrassiae]
MTPLAALTERSLKTSARDGGLIFELASPVVYLAGFSVALRGLVDTGELTYSQYLVPAVVVQSMIFVGLMTADRAVRDHLSWFGERLKTLPVAAVAPVAARMTATLIRAGLAMVVAVTAGYAFGFRFAGGFGYSVAFVLLALLLCLGVALGADALGSRANSIQGATYILFIPSLLLFMLSTGIAPESTFPEYLRPVVRNQPVSQAAEALRGLGAGHLTDNLAITLTWCIGMVLVFGTITIQMQRRTA